MPTRIILPTSLLLTHLLKTATPSCLRPVRPLSLPELYVLSQTLASSQATRPHLPPWLYSPFCSVNLLHLFTSF